MSFCIRGLLCRQAMASVAVKCVNTSSWPTSQVGCRIIPWHYTLISRCVGTMGSKVKGVLGRKRLVPSYQAGCYPLWHIYRPVPVNGNCWKQLPNFCFKVETQLTMIEQLRAGERPECVPGWYKDNRFC